MAATEIPIPARLAHRPVQGGMVVPWVALALADGTYDFAACEGRRSNLAMLDGICQVCGEPILPPLVFLMAEDQLVDMTTDVPPLHPECAAYSQRVCPMVTGRLAEYRNRASRATRHDQCAVPGCDCGGWVATDERQGPQDAMAWSAVWCRTYDRIAPNRATVAAIRAGYAVPGVRILARVTQPLRVRPAIARGKDSPCRS